MRGLTKSKFKSWLESKNPRTKVGHPEDCQSCPIAKFLLQTIGKQYTVGGLVISLYAPGNAYPIKEHPLPRWVGDFIEAVDMQGTKSVSAAKCLALLKAGAK